MLSSLIRRPVDSGQSVVEESTPIGIRVRTFLITANGQLIGQSVTTVKQTQAAAEELVDRLYGSTVSSRRRPQCSWGGPTTKATPIASHYLTKTANCSVQIKEILICHKPRRAHKVAAGLTWCWRRTKTKGFSPV